MQDFFILSSPSTGLTLKSLKVTVDVGWVKKVICFFLFKPFWFVVFIFFLSVLWSWLSVFLSDWTKPKQFSFSDDIVRPWMVKSSGLLLCGVFWSELHLSNGLPNGTNKFKEL